MSNCYSQVTRLFQFTVTADYLSHRLIEHRALKAPRWWSFSDHCSHAWKLSSSLERERKRERERFRLSCGRGSREIARRIEIAGPRVNAAPSRSSRSIHRHDLTSHKDPVMRNNGYPPTRWKLHETAGPRSSHSLSFLFSPLPLSPLASRAQLRSMYVWRSGGRVGRRGRRRIIV